MKARSLYGMAALAALALAGAVSACAQQAPPTQTAVVRAGRLFDAHVDWPRLIQFGLKLSF